MNKDKYSEELSIRLMPKGLLEVDEEFIGGSLTTPQTARIDEIGVRGSLIDIDEMNTTRAEIEEYEVGETPAQTEEMERSHATIDEDKSYQDPQYSVPVECAWDNMWYKKWKQLAPTTILSKAIEQVEQMGDYKVMVALVNLDKTKPKEDRLYTFTDIESKKLRAVIYKEIEKDMGK